MTVLGFTGTRLGMTAAQNAEVIDTLERVRPTEVRHGDCVGADAAFHLFASAATVRPHIVVHPPINPELRARCYGEDVEVLPALGYLARDRAIVDACDLLLACPAAGASIRGGTWFTINYALAQGMPVRVVHADGTVWPETGEGPR